MSDKPPRLIDEGRYERASCGHSWLRLEMYNGDRDRERCPECGRIYFRGQRDYRAELMERLRARKAEKKL